MRYSAGSKLFIFLIIISPVVVLWLMHAGHSHAQRWPVINNKISCTGGEPVEVHSLSQLDGKINAIAGSRRPNRSALCITNPRYGEWDIYGGQNIESTSQRND